MESNSAWLLCDECSEQRYIIPTTVFTSRKAVIDYVKQHEIDVHGKMIEPVRIDPDSIQFPLSFNDAMPLLDFLIGEENSNKCNIT